MLQDLFTMGNKKKVGSVMAVFETLVIKSGDQGLADTGSGYDQVFITPVQLSFCLQVVQDLLLIGIRTDHRFQMEIL